LKQKMTNQEVKKLDLERLVMELRQQIASQESKSANLHEQRDAMAQEIKSLHQQLQLGLETKGAMAAERLMFTPSSQSHLSPAMQVSDLLQPSPPLSSGSSSASSGGKASVESGKSRSLYETSSSMSNPILPLHALEEAQYKCKELEERLMQQDSTIQHLERSRSKFKKFAAKYEKEIEQVSKKAVV
jgi:hypothetical protein